MTLEREQKETVLIISSYLVFDILSSYCLSRFKVLPVGVDEY